MLAATIEGLRRALPGLATITIAGGERNKTRQAKSRLEDDLLSLGAGRDTVLIALGGGVVTDLAGFTAGTYLRGVPWVAMPTTLVGMVDAALGGKTGVNTPQGKNLVGLFHPPTGVVSLLETLATLPATHFRCGLAECLKHGLTMDAAHFEWVAGRDPRSLRRRADEIRTLVMASASLKCAVVEEDPRETTGRRNILNVGHTVGHALEKLSGFAMPHGEAVAAGLCWEAAAAVADGLLDRNDLPRVTSAVARLGFSQAWRATEPAAILEAARTDKKNRAGAVAYVPLGGIGRPALPPPHTAPLGLESLEAGLRLLVEV